MSRPASRPSTPSHAARHLEAGNSISRGGTPSRGSRPGTPNRVVKDPNAGYLTKKGMPNNLDLADPRVLDRASDLLGTTGTEPVADPPTEAELAKVRELAASLDKKKK
ncbi:hypothetical protein JCM10207_005012 [Rhodosporidiobolus poonsookiae]